MEQLTFSMKNNKRKGEGLELTTKPPHEYLCVNFPPPLLLPAGVKNCLPPCRACQLEPDDELCETLSLRLQSRELLGI